MTGEPSPVGGGLAFLDPLLGGAALVVEADDGPVRSAQRGDDEAHPGEEFAEMMLDLRDHTAQTVPGGKLVMEAPIADQRRVTRSAARPGEQVLDLPLQHVIGRQPDRVTPLAAL